MLQDPIFHNAHQQTAHSMQLAVDCATERIMSITAAPGLLFSLSLARSQLSRFHTSVKQQAPNMGDQAAAVLHTLTKSAAVPPHSKSSHQKPGFLGWDGLYVV